METENKILVTRLEGKDLGKCWSKDTSFNQTGGLNSADLLYNIMTTAKNNVYWNIAKRVDFKYSHHKK